MTFVANDFAMRVSLEKNRDFSLHFVDLQREKFANALRIVFKKKRTVGVLSGGPRLVRKKKWNKQFGIFFSFFNFLRTFFLQEVRFF